MLKRFSAFLRDSFETYMQLLHKRSLLSSRAEQMR